MRHATRIVVIVSSIIVSCTAVAQDRVVPDSNSRTSDTLVAVSDNLTEIFQRFNIAPVIVPGGEAVGDIIDARTTIRLADADQCFPALKTRLTPSQLPDAYLQSEKELLGNIGAGLIGQASAKVTTGQTFILGFTDVTVETVSLAQLKSALKKVGRNKIPECESVRPFLNAHYSQRSESDAGHDVNTANISNKYSSFIEQNIPSSMKKVVVATVPPPLLIGTVYKARRTIRVKTTQQLGVEGKVAFGKSLINKLGLDASFSVGGEGNTEKGYIVELIGKEPVVVAITPAYRVMASKSRANGQTEYEIAAINHEQVQKAVQLARFLQKKSFASVLESITKDPSAAKFPIILDKSEWVAKSAPKSAVDMWDNYMATLPPMPAPLVSKSSAYQKILGIDGRV